MSYHIFWPGLTALTMAVTMVMFLILKYGDRLCGARTVAQSSSSHYHMQQPPHHHLGLQQGGGGSQPSVRDMLITADAEEEDEAIRPAPRHFEMIEMEQQQPLSPPLPPVGFSPVGDEPWKVKTHTAI